MENINETIPYNWKYGWEGLSEPAPKVNRLLKAIIERNIVEMSSLVEQGASLKESDKTTLSRIIFHVMDSYPVMEWLVKHGVSRIGHDLDAAGNNGINEKNCISPYGYSWGLSGRAYYLKDYELMNLLCQHGFDDFGCFDEGWANTFYADSYILKEGDEKGLKILLENGYVISFWQDYKKYVLNRSQIIRKSIGLDSCLFRKKVEPKPQYEKVPLLFGKREVQRRNRRRDEDYADRLRVHSEFISSYGQTEYEAYVNVREAFERNVGQMMVDVMLSREN